MLGKKHLIDQTSENAAITTAGGAPIALTRREMLASLGALAIGIAWKTAQAAPRPAWTPVLER
jgi:hypothetical protein